MSEQTRRARTAQRLRDLRECLEQQTGVAALWEGSYREAIAERDTALRQRDEAYAVLRRYTDLVLLDARTYRERYGPVADHADAMDEFYRAARDVLRQRDDAAPDAARPPEAGA